VKTIEIGGLRFGRLSVVRRAYPENGKTSAAMWLCRCDCGKDVIVTGGALRSGSTVSCGCYVKECFDEHRASRSHGLMNAPGYYSWCNMKDRCNNEAHPAYRDYGGRGIRVCERWSKSFPAFLEDLGPKPGSGYSVNRINNDGNYEPGNCRWATQKEQCRNTRVNHLMTCMGRTQTMIEWSEEMGLPDYVIGLRLRYGWTDEQAIMRPLEFRPQRKAALHDAPPRKRARKGGRNG